MMSGQGKQSLLRKFNSWAVLKRQQEPSRMMDWMTMQGFHVSANGANRKILKKANWNLRVYRFNGEGAEVVNESDGMTLRSALVKAMRAIKV